MKLKNFRIEILVIEILLMSLFISGCGSFIPIFRF